MFGTKRGKTPPTTPQKAVKMRTGIHEAAILDEISIFRRKTSSEIQKMTISLESSDRFDRAENICYGRDANNSGLAIQL